MQSQGVFLMRIFPVVLHLLAHLFGGGTGVFGFILMVTMFM